MDTTKTGNWKRSVLSVLAGLAAAVLLLLLFGAIFAIFLTFTSLEEGRIASVSLILIALAMLAGGIVTAMIVQNKGLYHGLALGLCFFILLLITGKHSGSMDFVALCIKGAAALVAAALGGILGIRKK